MIMLKRAPTQQVTVLILVLIYIWCSLLPQLATLAESALEARRVDMDGSSHEEAPEWNCADESCLADKWDLMKFRQANRLTKKAFMENNNMAKTSIEGRNRETVKEILEQAILTSALAFDARHKLALIKVNEGDNEGAIRLWNASQENLLEFLAAHPYDATWDTVLDESIFPHGSRSDDALPHKLLHDAEQLEYLASLKNIRSKDVRERFVVYAHHYREAAKYLELRRPHMITAVNEYGYQKLNPATLSGVMGSTWGNTWLKPHETKLKKLKKSKNVQKVKNLSSSSSSVAIQDRSVADVKELVEEFKKNRILVVDNVLTPEALDIVYECLLRSPIWHDVKPNGYLGAYPSTGLTLAHPVFLTIGREFPIVYKEIFDLFDPSLLNKEDLTLFHEEGTVVNATAGHLASTSKTTKKRRKRKDKKDKKKKKKKKKGKKTSSIDGEKKEKNKKVKKNTSEEDTSYGTRDRGSANSKQRNIATTRKQHDELNMIWSYKYDNTPGSSSTHNQGISVHADDAVININLWITPDSANLDDGLELGEASDGGGGLIVYLDSSEDGPKGWENVGGLGEVKVVKSGSDGEDALLQVVTLHDKQRLEWKGRANITIPYKQNRMVIFDSSRYHRSAKYRFRSGYKNRRINLTFLYGSR